VDYSAEIEGTVLAMPMLSDSRIQCRDANRSGDFISAMVVASQSRNATIIHAELYLHHPGSEKECEENRYARAVHTDIEYYLYVLDFNACLTNKGCASWLTLCKEEVYGINYQIDNPTFSAVAVAFTPSFHHCLAVYPLLGHENQQPPEESNLKLPFTYHVVHSRRYTTSLKGFTIQNPYNTDTNPSLNLTGRAIGLDNGRTLIPMGVSAKLTIKCRGVLWVEPDYNSTEGLPLSLGGSVISSSTPLNVFTNLAVFDNSKPTREFEFDSQLVQQMPERRHWGKHFTINPRNSQVLPDEMTPCLQYEITIVSYTAENSIHVGSDLRNTELGALDKVSDDHYEYTLHYSQPEMAKMAYLEIASTSQIMVLSEAYTTTEPSACQDFSISYSTLVQPVEWHANKQIIVLVHPNDSITYHYLISIVVPSRASDPADVLESQSNETCHGEPVSKYQTSRHRADNSNTLVTITYERFIVRSEETQTRLLLRHSDPATSIGVTVYAYAEDLHYSYSNGYTIGKQPLFRGHKPPNNRPKPPNNRPQTSK
jgi:hypothetical protein